MISEIMESRWIILILEKDMMKMHSLTHTLTHSHQDTVTYQIFLCQCKWVVFMFISHICHRSNPTSCFSTANFWFLIFSRSGATWRSWGGTCWIQPPEVFLRSSTISLSLFSTLWCSCAESIDISVKMYREIKIIFLKFTYVPLLLLLLVLVLLWTAYLRYGNIY